MPVNKSDSSIIPTIFFTNQDRKLRNVVCLHSFISSIQRIRGTDENGGMIFKPAGYDITQVSVLLSFKKALGREANNHCTSLINILFPLSHTKWPLGLGAVCSRQYFRAADRSVSWGGIPARSPSLLTNSFAAKNFLDRWWPYAFSGQWKIGNRRNKIFPMPSTSQSRHPS